MPRPRGSIAQDIFKQDPEDQGELPMHLMGCSRMMAMILRHSAESYGLRLESDGWCSLRNLLSVSELQSFTEDDVKFIVSESYSKDRPRFELKFEEETGLWIRATHKHSIAVAQQAEGAAPVPPVAAAGATKAEGAVSEPHVAAAGSEKAPPPMLIPQVAAAPPPPLADGAASAPQAPSPVAEAVVVKAPPPKLRRSPAEEPSAGQVPNGIVEAPAPMAPSGLAEAPVSKAPPPVLQQSSAHRPSVALHAEDPLQVADPWARFYGVDEDEERPPRTAKPPERGICVGFLRTGSCMYGESCKHLHTEANGHAPSGQASGSAPSGQGSGGAPSGASFFKTRMCFNFQEGRCFRGASCSYAHRPEELRPFIHIGPSQGGAVAASSSSSSPHPPAVALSGSPPPRLPLPVWAAAASRGVPTVLPVTVVPISASAAPAAAAAAVEPSWHEAKRGSPPGSAAAAPEAGVVSAAAAAGAQGPHAWRKFRHDDGRRCWYWCEATQEWFSEDDPGPWARYADVDSGEVFWCKDDGSTWFWDVPNDAPN